MATNVQAPLPDLALEEEAVLTVTAGDPGAVITQLVIHFTQELPTLAPVTPALPPAFGYAGGNSNGEVAP